MQSIANFLLIQFPKYITETRKKLSVVALPFLREWWGRRRCSFECGAYLLVSAMLRGETLIKERVLAGM